MYIHVPVYTYICIYMCVYICIYIFIYICIYSMYIHIYAGCWAPRKSMRFMYVYLYNTHTHSPQAAGRLEKVRAFYALHVERERFGDALRALARRQASACGKEGFFLLLLRRDRLPPFCFPPQKKRCCISCVLMLLCMCRGRCISACITEFIEP